MTTNDWEPLAVFNSEEDAATGSPVPPHDKDFIDRLQKMLTSIIKATYLSDAILEPLLLGMNARDMRYVSEREVECVINGLTVRIKWDNDKAEVYYV